MNLIAIGNRIKQSRKAQKYTQETLAEKLDVSPHYIYEIERGSKTMSLKMLMAMKSKKLQEKMKVLLLLFISKIVMKRRIMITI